MRRHVIVRVDDDGVTHLDVEHTDENRSRGLNDYRAVVNAERIPVPPDDQFGQVVNRLTRAAEKQAEWQIDGEGELMDDVFYLRAAFQLDDHD